MLAGLVAGPVLGGLGTLVVVKRHAFFSEAVGHAALTGVAIGILLGEPYTGPYGSLFGYCLFFGIALNYLRNRTGLSADTLICVFLSMSLALGASILLVLAGRINIIGAILVGALLVIPAAAARTVSGSLKGFFALSVLFALAATITGILIPWNSTCRSPRGQRSSCRRASCFSAARPRERCFQLLKEMPHERIALSPGHALRHDCRARPERAGRGVAGEARRKSVDGASRRLRADVAACSG